MQMEMQSTSHADDRGCTLGEKVPTFIARKGTGRGGDVPNQSSPSFVRILLLTPSRERAVATLPALPPPSKSQLFALRGRSIMRTREPQLKCRRRLQNQAHERGGTDGKAPGLLIRCGERSNGGDDVDAHSAVADDARARRLGPRDKWPRCASQHHPTPRRAIHPTSF
jgi:hypothetical protein